MADGEQRAARSAQRAARTRQTRVMIAHDTCELAEVLLSVTLAWQFARAGHSALIIAQNVRRL